MNVSTPSMFPSVQKYLKYKQNLDMIEGKKLLTVKSTAFESLPEDILHSKLFSFLNSQDQANARIVSKTLIDTFNKEQLSKFKTAKCIKSAFNTDDLTPEQMIEIFLATKHHHLLNSSFYQLNKRFILAAENNLIEIIPILINIGADVDSKNHYGFSALHVACCSGNIETIGLLIELGAQVDAKDNENFTPIHYASQHGHIKIIEFLMEKVKFENPLFYTIQHGHLKTAKFFIEASANINIQDSNRNSPLHIAAKENLTELVPLLIHKGANINARNNEGYTPVHLAASNGNIEILKLFASSQAKLYLKTNAGLAPCYFASKNGYINVVKFLLSSIGFIKLENLVSCYEIALQNNHDEIANFFYEFFTSKIDVNKVNEFERLHSATKNGHTHVVKFLIEYGFDINHKNENGETALYLAALNHRTGIVQLLLKHKAYVFLRNKNNETPLYAAVSKGHTEIVQLFMDHDSYTRRELTDSYHINPLYIAISKNYIDIVKIFIQYNIDINLKIVSSKWHFTSEDTPLNYAIQNKHPKMVKLLLEYGADTLGNSLHKAVYTGQIEIVELLIEANATFNYTNSSYTSLHFAAEIGYTEIVQLIFDSCNNNYTNLQNLKDDNGYTPMHYAIQNGHFKIIEILKNHSATLTWGQWFLYSWKKVLNMVLKLWK